MRTRKETVFGIDFDGTCVLHEYPEVGPDVPHAATVLKRLVDAGHKLVLNTMRSDRDGTLADAVKWFAKHELPLHGINNNPDQNIWTNSPKVYANVYIDDAALGCPTMTVTSIGRPFVEWWKVEEMLEQMGLL